LKNSSLRELSFFSIVIIGAENQDFPLLVFKLFLHFKKLEGQNRKKLFLRGARGPIKDKGDIKE
jgi:hypothetical protein